MKRKVQTFARMFLCKLWGEMVCAKKLGCKHCKHVYLQNEHYGAHISFREAIIATLHGNSSLQEGGHGYYVPFLNNMPMNLSFTLWLLQSPDDGHFAVRIGLNGRVKPATRDKIFMGSVLVALAHAGYIMSGDSSMSAGG